MTGVPPDARDRLNSSVNTLLVFLSSLFLAFFLCFVNKQTLLLLAPPSGLRTVDFKLTGALSLDVGSMGIHAAL